MYFYCKQGFYGGKKLAKYAYARALPGGQSLNKQIGIFSQFGVLKEGIYTDDKPAARVQYGNLLEALKKGDLLVIKTLHALGDSYDAIATEWTRITSSIGADIYVADMPALDTRTAGVRDTICAVVVQLLNFCAEKERAHSALQAKGIQSAKERGVKFGRPMTKYSDEFITAVRRYKSGEISMREALTLTGLKQSSFYYHIHKMDELNYFAK